MPNFCDHFKPKAGPVVLVGLRFNTLKNSRLTARERPLATAEHWVTLDRLRLGDPRHCP
jgi:hypothetical protein